MRLFKFLSFFFFSSFEPVFYPAIGPVKSLSDPCLSQRDQKVVTVLKNISFLIFHILGPAVVETPGRMLFVGGLVNWLAVAHGFHAYFLKFL